MGIDTNKVQNVETICEELRNRILSGYYPPSHKFNQNDIAKEFNVSRTPVIKALNLFAFQGIVDNIPQKGFYLHVQTVKDVLELFYMREAMEQIIVNDLVRYANERNIEALKNCFLPFKDIHSSEIDIKQYSEADNRFHEIMMGISQNTLVNRVYTSFQLGIRYHLAGLFRNPSGTLPEHFSIVDAISTKDHLKLSETLKRHSGTTRMKLEKACAHLIEIGINPSSVPFTEFTVGNER